MTLLRIRMLPLALPYAVLGGALLLAYHGLGGASPLVQAVLYCLIAVSAAAAVFGGILLRVHRASRPWILMGVSMACWAAGDIVWYALDLTGATPYPSLADLLYLVGYLFLGAALLWITLAGSDRRQVLADLIDASLISLCVAVASWPFVLEPTLEDGWGASAAVAVSYGAADILIVGLLAALIFNASKRTTATVLLGISMLAVFVADVIYYVPSFASSDWVDSWSSASWLLGYVLVGIAGLHGTRRRRKQRPASSGRSHSAARRLAFMGVTLLALPGSIVLDTMVGDGLEADEWGVIAAALALAVALIVARTSILVREIEESRAHNIRMRVRLESVFESAGVGIVIGDGTHIDETNSAFRAMLGYTEHELARLRYSDILHPDEIEQVVETSAAPGERSTFECRYVHRDGSTVLGRVTHTTAPGDALHIAVVEDITLKAEQDRQRQEGQKLEAVGRLAGGIAHDFNNLLTAVTGHAELIRLAQSPDDVDESARIIIEAGGRAAALTRQLLTFSRQHVAVPERIDTPNLLRRSCDLLGRLLPASVRVELVVDDDAPPIMANLTQIDQVLLNLALNASDAMPDGGTLTLSVGSFTAPALDARYAGIDAGEYCRITVADTGAGMDEVTARRVFEPFFTTKDVGKGTGLGLATTHGIITQAGGHILVSSELGRGSAFEIVLPAATAVPDRPAPARQPDLVRQH